jgi:hypothetical protein
LKIDRFNPQLQQLLQARGCTQPGRAHSMASKSSETVKVRACCLWWWTAQHIMRSGINPAPLAARAQVVVRCRPLNEREQTDGRQRIVDVDDRLGQIVVSRAC